MMLRLILLESRQLARERFAWMLLLFLGVACALAFISGSGLMDQQIDGRALAARGDATATVRVVNVLKPGADPALAILAPYWVRTQAVSPAPPLADFSSGRATFEPHASVVTLRSREDTLFERTAVDNPEMGARGILDLGFVAIVLAPLMLIGLGYGLFAGDRDSGVARLLLVEGGTPRRLLLARSVPRLLLVLLPIAATAAALLIASHEADGRIDAARWWLLLAISTLLFWWSVILLVNAVQVGAETAALVLVALWAMLTLILPALIAAAAQLAYPPPSRFEQIATARAAEVSATSAYENDHPDLAADGVEGRLASIRKSLAVGRAVDAAVAPVSRQFDAQLAGQQRVVQMLAWASPPLKAADAMTAAAGTDVERALGFRRATTTYMDELKQALGGFVDRGVVMQASEHEALPAFSWTPVPASPWQVLAFLLGLSALLSGSAWVLFGRAEP